MIEIPLERGGASPLYRQMADHLRRMVVSGTLEPGYRLPGSRELALAHGVSRTTAKQAYDLLEAEGYVEEKGRSGTYVRGRCPSIAGIPFRDLPSWDMASGLPSPDLLPSGRLARLSRDLLTSSAEGALSQAPVGGLEKLRQALVRHAALRGIPAHWDQVAVTGGGQEGLSSALGSFWSIGARKLWVEELTYPDVLEMAHRQGYELGVLPQGEPDLIRSLSQVGAGDILYCIPSFQNPTGRTLSLAARKAVLEASLSRSFWVIEDDTYGELRFGGESVPALKALNGSGRVLYIGSFSQLLFPGLRLGYALVPRELNEEFLCLKASRGAFPSSLVQYLILAFIEERALEDALGTVRSAMAIRMERLCGALEKELPRCSFQRPRGGIYLWLETPGLDGAVAVEKAAVWDVALSSGKTYSARGDSLEAVRLSVSRLGPRDLEKAVGLLRKAWSDVPWIS